MLCGFLVIEVDVIGIGRDRKDIDAELRREQCRRAVFVNDGFYSVKRSAGANYRDTAAATRDYERAVFDQIANHFKFYDFNGLRRWNNTAVTAGGIFNNFPSERAFALLGLSARIEGSNGFGGMRHRRVIR